MLGVSQSVKGKCVLVGPLVLGCLEAQQASKQQPELWGAVSNQGGSAHLLLSLL